MQDERLLAAAKSDNEDMLLEIFELVESPEQTKPFDINHHDGFVRYCSHVSTLSHRSIPKAWQYRCLDHNLQAQVITAKHRTATPGSDQPYTTREVLARYLTLG
jgi:hypothetical protein